MKRIALLFPGQGAQYIGMGQNICRKYKIAEHIFNEASETLGFDLKKMCFESDLELLTKTENAQPALLTTSYANYLVLQKTAEINPCFLAGHSLGEFSALVCAKALRFADAVKLVRKRGELMAKASEGGMAAVTGLDEGSIRETCKEVSGTESYVVVSNINSPDQVILSGHKSAIAKAEEQIIKKGGKIKVLNVSAAFHSPLMNEAAKEFKEVLKNVDFKLPHWPVISNVSAMPMTKAEVLAEELYQQLVNPVQWQAGMVFMKRQDVTTFIDIGPGQVVKNLAIKNIPDASVYAFDKPSDVEAMETQFPVNAFKPKISFLPKAMAIAVCTKNNNQDSSEYDSKVTKPYLEIQNINQSLEEQKIEADKQQMQKAVDMLISVFEAKKTPISEQMERFHQLFDETETWDYFPTMNREV